MKLLFIAAAFALALSPLAASAQNMPTQYPIKADDGDAIGNFDLSAAALAKVKALPGQVTVGDSGGDVTVMQFYDLNCPYCRAAAHDIDAIVRADGHLKLIFVPYPVLSVESIRGALIELGAAKMLGPPQYLDFHRRLYDSRGVIDGDRALVAAKDSGLDPAKVAAAGNTQANLDILKQNATVGGEAGLQVTPAYVVGSTAIIGHPGRKALEKVIASMRKCGKVACKLDAL
jgi:protein-disulfide isomerase